MTINDVKESLKNSGRHVSMDAPLVEGEDSNLYDVLNSDYSFYCVWRGYLNSYEEAREVKECLEKFYREKLVNYQPKEKSNILIFK